MRQVVVSRLRSGEVTEFNITQMISDSVFFCCIIVHCAAFLFFLAFLVTFTIKSESESDRVY